MLDGPVTIEVEPLPEGELMLEDPEDPSGAPVTTLVLELPGEVTVPPEGAPLLPLV